MTTKFGPGGPRSGQWVLWGEHAAIYCGDGATMAPGGRGARKVARFDPALKAYVPADLDPAKVAADEGVIDVVDAETGATKLSVLVKHAELEPVANAEKIPAPRRATAPQGWVPGGAEVDRRQSDWGFVDRVKRTPEQHRAAHDLVDAWTSARWAGDTSVCEAAAAKLAVMGAWVKVRE